MRNPQSRILAPKDPNKKIASIHGKTSRNEETQGNVPGKVSSKEAHPKGTRSPTHPEPPGENSSSFRNKTSSSLSAQAVSGSSFRRANPKYHGWLLFVKRFEKIQATRVNAADKRSNIIHARKNYRELSKILCHRLEDVAAGDESAKLDLLENIPTLLKEFAASSAELEAKEQDCDEIEQQLVKEEYDAYQVVPWLKEQDETFLALKIQGLDFHERCESAVSGPTVSWTSHRPLDDDSGAFLSPPAKRVDDLEDQILKLRAERRKMLRQELHSHEGDTTKPEEAAMDVLDETDMRLQLSYGHARSELQWVRNEIESSEDASDGRHSQDCEDIEIILRATSAETGQAYDAAMSLYVAGSESMPVFLDCPENHIDPFPVNDRINAWLLHKMRRSKLELAKFATALWRAHVDTAAAGLPNDVIRSWFSDKTSDVPAEQPAPVPSSKGRSIENVGPTMASQSKQPSNLAASNLAPSNPAREPDHRSSSI